MPITFRLYELFALSVALYLLKWTCTKILDRYASPKLNGFLDRRKDDFAKLRAGWAIDKAKRLEQGYRLAGMVAQSPRLLMGRFGRTAAWAVLAFNGVLFAIIIVFSLRLLDAEARSPFEFDL